MGHLVLFSPITWNSLPLSGHPNNHQSCPFLAAGQLGFLLVGNSSPLSGQFKQFITPFSGKDQGPLVITEGILLTFHNSHY